MKFMQALALGAMLSLSALSASATYPERPIRMVVPFPAGSGTDTMVRIIAEPLSKALGQNIVVENKPGADGSVAAADVARAKPDGYTLLMATNSPLSAVPALRKNPPYDAVADFTPITDVGRYRYFVLVHPSLPVHSIDELIEYAKQRPGELNFATGNTFGQVSTFQFMRSNGFEMMHIPYKGEPAALTDFVAGRVQFMFATQSTSLPFVSTGKLRALATTSGERLEQLPEVPTLKEVGLPDMPTLPWAALFGPADMPDDIVTRLNKEMNTILAREDVKQQLSKQAFETTGSTPEQLATMIEQQIGMWKTSLAELCIQPE